MILRLVEGYVVVACWQECGIKKQIFYGPAQDSRYLERGFEAFSSALVPFTTLEEAKRPLDNIRQMLSRRSPKLKIGQLKMEIADSVEELVTNPIFLKSKSLIIVWKTDMGFELIGRYIEGKPPVCNALPGAYLSENSLKTWPSYVRVMRCRGEFSRQSGSSATTLAIFSFQWVR